MLPEVCLLLNERRTTFPLDRDGTWWLGKIAPSLLPNSLLFCKEELFPYPQQQGLST